MAIADDILFKLSPTEYGESYHDDYLRMYRDYVLSADQISGRRHAANSLFLGLNTALLGLTGYFTDVTVGNLLWVAALSGVMFSFTWWRLIASYRSLNSAKFLVIHQLESRLPFAAYDAEWEHLKRGRSKEHIPFSQVEAWVPLVFMLLHGVVAAINLVAWLK